MDADRNFGLLRRDILYHSKECIDRCFKAEVSEKLPTMKGANVSINLKPVAKPMFCAARKVTLPLERKINRTIDELLLLGILEPVEDGGLDFCSPVAWVKKVINYARVLLTKSMYMIKLVPKPTTYCTPYLVMKPFSQKCQAINFTQKFIYQMLIGKFHLMKNHNMCLQ